MFYRWNIIRVFFIIFDKCLSHDIDPSVFVLPVFSRSAFLVVADEAPPASVITSESTFDRCTSTVAMHRLIG